MQIFFKKLWNKFFKIITQVNKIFARKFKKNFRKKYLKIL